MKNSLPKTIYAVRRTEDKESWLEADDAIYGFEAGASVGVYQLVEVKKKQITHTLAKGTGKGGEPK